MLQIVGSDGDHSKDSFPKSSETAQTYKVPANSTVERSFLDGVRASIGAGGVVQKVVTAFDSYRVTLANVPDEASHEEMIAMADAFGRLKSVILNPPASGTKRTAKLEYIDADSARVAADTLDGVELHSQSLTAQLDLRSVALGTADLKSSTLKMSWFSPARMAFAHYGSMWQAESKAFGLNGRSIFGRKIITVFQAPSSSQKTSFSVIIKNLPLLLNPKELKNFCRTDSVTINQANYHGKEGIKKVQDLLETFGPLESFDCSHTSLNDMKVKVLARFVKPEHAAVATKMLHGQSQHFLGGAKTWITLLHSVKYNISRAQYRVLEDDLRGISTNDLKQSVKVRVYDKDEEGRSVELVCIRIYGDDPKLLGRFKTQIEALVSGEEIMHEGASLWDAFFLSAGGKSFADKVQMRSGAFVRLDARRRKIRVSGSSQSKDHARVLLLEKFLELREQHHQLILTRIQLGRLMQGEFSRLQEILGEEKLSLDIRNKILVVRGDDEDIKATRLSLATLQATTALPAANNNGGISDCPVCFCEATTPVRLACNHTYCFSCLRHYLASAESFPVKCLAEDATCDLLIPLSIINDMLSVGEETKFFDDVFLTYIRQHSNEYHFCPTPDCQQIYRTSEPGNIILRCPSCLSRICPSCHVEFHEGLTCAEHQDDQAGNLSAYNKWKEENNVQSCPNCKVDIEKSMGCNHITCVRCGSHICWVCLKTWPDGSVIYKHMSDEHGGFGL